MNKNSKVTVETPCQTCKGTGRITPCYGHCRKCGHAYDDTSTRTMYPEAWAAAQLPGANGYQLPETLPCGCSWDQLFETDYCGECESTGTITETCTLEELLKPQNEEIAKLTALTDAIYNSLNDGHKECINIELGLPI